MKQSRALEDRGGWCFQAMHIKGEKSTLVNGLTRYLVMIPLRRLFLVGMVLGTRGYNSGCASHYIIKKVLMVNWSSCGSDQAVRLEELPVAEVFELKERRKRSGHRGMLFLVSLL